MIVIFDFDDTLCMTVPDADVGIRESGPNMEVIAKMRAIAANGDLVLIVTTRVEHREGWDTSRTTVADFVKEHNLPVSAVHFTDGALKGPLLAQLGVSKHFDDDPVELSWLPDHIEGVRVDIDPAWDSPS